MHNRLPFSADYVQLREKGACLYMFPLITNMEEFMIYMGGGFQYLPSHFRDETGGSGFSSKSLAGDSDAQAVAGTGNRNV